MPRTLPWKRHERDVSVVPDQHTKREEGRKPGDGEDSLSAPDVGNATRKSLKRPRASTPTSLPRQLPQEDSMIEGIDGDDRYRMVEDEFLATARQFTAHLHAAEYKRLKAASEIENAQTIRNISRPVVGQMTDLVRGKRERTTPIEKQRLVAQELRKVSVSGDESTEAEHLEDSWQSQSLCGLMESPGRRAGFLDGLPLATSVTRAAAGYNRRVTDAVITSQLESRVLPDATRHHTRRSEPGMGLTSGYHDVRRAPPLAPTTSSRVTGLEASTIKTPQPGGFYNTAEHSHEHQSEKIEERTVSDDEDMDFIARLKKRQAERRRSRQQRKSTGGKVVKSDLDDILPDFP